MIAISSNATTVYRARNGFGKTRLTAMTAYKDAAWFAWKDKHFPCGCESETGFVCGYHRDDNYATELACQRRLVIARLARWLMWRDGVRISMRLTKLCVRLRKEYDSARDWRKQ